MSTGNLLLIEPDTLQDHIIQVGGAFLDAQKQHGTLNLVAQEALSVLTLSSQLSSTPELASVLPPQLTADLTLANTLLGNLHAVDELDGEVGTEGVLADATIRSVKYLWNELMIIIGRIIDALTGWIKAIFTRKRKVAKSATWFLNHFAKYPIDDSRFRVFEAAVPTCEELTNRLTNLYSLGVAINPIMQQFKAAGELRWSLLKSQGHLSLLQRAGFVVEQADSDHVRIESLNLSSLTSDNSTESMIRKGWTAYSLIETLNHVVRVSESLDRLTQIQAELKPTFLDNVKAQVKTEEDRRPYLDGINLIDRLILLYTNALVASSERVLVVAAMARKFSV